jgi:hypothetical protein
MDPGASARVVHDIIVNNQVAFRQGEIVRVEAVTPDAQRPEYKYLVTSSLLGTSYVLSDADLAVAQPTQVPVASGAPAPPPATIPPTPPAPQVAPGYPQYPPQAPVPRKTNGAAKGCLLAAAIVAGIVIILVIVLVGVIGVGVHHAVKVVENQIQGKVVNVSVGQTGQSGSLAVKVNGWQPSAGDAITMPAAGNQFIVVDLEIRNTGTSTESVSTLVEMSIRTPNGLKYDLAAFFPEPKFPEGDILPGQSARGNVAFEVPGNIGSMSFWFDPLLGDRIEVKLQ